MARNLYLYSRSSKTYLLLILICFCIKIATMVRGNFTINELLHSGTAERKLLSWNIGMPGKALDFPTE